MGIKAVSCAEVDGACEADHLEAVIIDIVSEDPSMANDLRVLFEDLSRCATLALMPGTVH